MPSTLPLPSPHLRDPPSWVAQPLPLAYDNLEGLVQESMTKRVIEDLPDSESAATKDGYEFRARVISERLWLLGYIKGSKVRAKSLYRDERQQFIRVVKQFQNEANLVSDGWVGKKTWGALEDLVSFEGSAISETWFETENTPIALLRAVQCRMHVLGISQSKASPEFERLKNRDLKQLQRVLISLKLIEPGSSATDEKVMRLILFQDAIVERLSSLAQPDPNKGNARSKVLVFRFFRDPSWDRRKHLRLMQKFILQVAKVELWLLGYEIKLDGKTNFPVKYFPPISGRRNSDISKVMKSFYATLAKFPKRKANKYNNQVTPEFFRFIHSQNEIKTDINAVTGGSEFDDVSILTDHFQTQDLVDQAIVEGRSLGMRIWDGIKRMFKWFSRKFRRVVEIGKNLVRGFYRYATKGVQIVRRAIRAFMESVKTFLDGEIQGTGAHWPFIEFKKDMDARIYSGPDTSILGQYEVSRSLSLFSARFRFSAAIIGLIFEAIVSGALQHWARFARTLVLNIKDILPLYRKIQHIEENLRESI